MTRTAPKLPCPMCGKPTDDPDGLVCSGCKQTLEQRAKANPSPANEYCSSCGRWKTLPGPDLCGDCKAKSKKGNPPTVDPTPQSVGPHIEARQREAFEQLGASAAKLYLVISKAFGRTTDLRDPSDVAALQAWMFGFATAWGTSDEIRDALLARFGAEILQSERTNSAGGAPPGPAGEGRAEPAWKDRK